MSVPAIVVVGSYAVGMTIRTKKAPLSGETVEGHDFTRMHGGKGSNQAIACARLGSSVKFVACIGEDAHGDGALALCRNEGLSIDYVTRHPDLPTAVGFVIVEASGENQIVIDFGANLALKPDHVLGLADRFAGSKVWVSQLEIRSETAAAAMKAGKGIGATTILNPAPYRQIPEYAWRHIDILTPNEQESRQLLGLNHNDRTRTEDLAAQIVAKGVRSAVLTLGARGAYVLSETFAGYVAAPDITAVDTTGAGDTFTAALATAMAEGRSLEGAVQFAVAAAALSVTRYGVIPSLPTRSELESFIARFIGESQGQ